MEALILFAFFIMALIPACIPSWRISLLACGIVLVGLKHGVVFVMNHSPELEGPGFFGLLTIFYGLKVCIVLSYLIRAIAYPLSRGWRLEACKQNAGIVLLGFLVPVVLVAADLLPIYLGRAGLFTHEFLLLAVGLWVILSWWKGPEMPRMNRRNN